MAQEPQRVFIARKRDTDPAKPPQFSFDKKDRRVTVYYFYLWDADFGPAFIKVCTYCPWPIKVWLNGHEWAKRQATQADRLHRVVQRVRRMRRSGRVAGDLRPARTGHDQRVLPALAGPAAIAAHRRRPRRRLLVGAVHGAGRGLPHPGASPSPATPAGFFEALVTDNLDLGRPDTIEIIFDRQIRGGKRATGGEFKTKVVTRGTEVTVNAFYKHSRIKQYLKDGRALRIETVINAPNDLGCQRRLHNLDELQTKARAINARLLQAERVGQGCVLANPVFERIAHPTVTAEGRRATAMRFGDSRVQALAGALCVTLCAVTGITNRSLRALMTGLLGTPYGITQASYDLARLRRNGLIVRRPHTNTYDLTADGLRFAIFYTKVHDRVLRPALRRRPTPSTTRTPHRATHPRPTHRSTTGPRPPPRRSLKLGSTVEALATKGP